MHPWEGGLRKRGLGQQKLGPQLGARPLTLFWLRGFPVSKIDKAEKKLVPTDSDLSTGGPSPKSGFFEGALAYTSPECVFV